MGKYIIEVGDAYVRHALGRKLIIPVIINNDTEYWVNTNIQLTPYTESDIEKIREEVFKNGYDAACKDIDIKSKTNAAYRKGLDDAWEAVKKLARMDTDTSEFITGYFGLHSIMHNLTASEAIEKIRQHEQEQEQIQVGDEVRNVKSGWTAVVTRISDDDCLTLMDGNGAIADGYEITRFTKTGRHFPKLVALQEEMRLI